MTNFPRVLDLNMSACSLDVSVLADSSSSLCSISESCVQQPEVHRQPTFAPFKAYKDSRNNLKNLNKLTRWTTPVDALGGSAHNSAPSRKPSHTRLSNPRLHETDIDVAVSLPCRMCSQNSLKNRGYQHATTSDTGPVNVPVRRESHRDTSKEAVVGGRAAAALDFHYRSKNKSKNFEWSTGSKSSSSHSSGKNTGSKSASSHSSGKNTGSKSNSSHSGTSSHSSGKNTGLIGFQFSLLDQANNIITQRGDASMPPRRGSNFEASLTSFAEEPSPEINKRSTMMPPSFPARKKSVVDFDDAVDSSGRILPPKMSAPPQLSMRPMMSTASGPAVPCKSRRRGSMSDVPTPSSSYDHTVFMAMPPVTRFERRASGDTIGSCPTPFLRHGCLQRQESCATAPPSFPERKDSMATFCSED